MAIEIDNDDLRILSLLHALGDKEELIHEAVRLLLETNISEAGWTRVRSMGIEIAPKNPLFNSNRTLQQLRSEYAEYSREVRRIAFDRRKEERRVVQRRTVPNRRSDVRRTTTLPWLGEERRTAERRQSVRLRI